MRPQRAQRSLFFEAGQAGTEVFIAFFEGPTWRGGYAGGAGGRSWGNAAGLRSLPQTAPSLRGACRGSALAESVFSASSRNGLNSSGAPVEAGRNLSPVDDHRHAAVRVRIAQHLLHALRAVQHIDVAHLTTFFRVGFTSRAGIGSGILAENQHGFAHRASESKWFECLATKTRCWTSSSSRLQPCQCTRIDL